MIEDWEFFLRLSAHMGYQLRIAGDALEMSTSPSSQAMLKVLAGQGLVSLSVLPQAPHGLVSPKRQTTVAPGDAAMSGHRLQLLPQDVADELAGARSQVAPSADFPLSLTVRRIREVMNSLGREIPGLPKQTYNPANMNPADIQAHGIADGEIVELRSAQGRIVAVARADNTVGSDTVSTTQCWGAADAADPRSGGSNVDTLIDRPSKQIQGQSGCSPKPAGIPHRLR